MSGRAATALAAALLVLAACGEEARRRGGTSGGGEPLEIEDVTPPVDAGLSTDDDVKGAKIEDAAGVSGVFPGDYPRDLPMHEPASIVDFGAAPGGWSYVDLDSPSSRALVAADLERRLTRAGWAVEGSGAEGLRASRAGVEVRMLLTGSSAGTRIRVEYR